MRLRRVVPLVALVAAVAPVPARAAAPAAPNCHRIAVSPAFAADGTVFCVVWVRTPTKVSGPLPNQSRTSPGTKQLLVHRTTNAGRAWQRVESNLPYDADTVPGDLAVSPLYATDRTFAIHLSNYGVLTSRDGGATFVPADPAAVSVAGPRAGAGHLAAFAQQAGPERAAAFGYYDGHVGVFQDPDQPAPARVAFSGNTALIPATGGHVPALGAPGLSSSGFALSPTFGAGGDGYVVTYALKDAGSVGWRWRFMLWACDTRLACTEPRHVFPDDWLPLSQPVFLDKTGQRLAIVLYEDLDVENRHPVLHVWRSSNGGRTWEPWRALERIVAPFNAASRGRRTPGQVLPEVAIAVEPTAFQRVVVRVTAAALGEEHSALRGPLPVHGEQVWVSGDGGRRFTRTAYGPTIGQRGRGTLPWHGRDAASDLTLAVAPGGRMFTSALTTKGNRVTYSGMFCSTDGRRWSRTC